MGGPMSYANESEDSGSAKDRRHPVIPEDATIILPVRNMLLFPGMVLPLTIGRPASDRRGPGSGAKRPQGRLAAAG
jgi:hypothetical protein